MRASSATYSTVKVFESMEEVPVSLSVSAFSISVVSYLEVVEHLNGKEDNDRDKSQNRQTGNQEAQPSLTSLCASWPARSFCKQVFAMPRILQNIRGIERASSGGCALDPLL